MRLANISASLIVAMFGALIDLGIYGLYSISLYLGLIVTILVGFIAICFNLIILLCIITILKKDK